MMLSVFGIVCVDMDVLCYVRDWVVSMGMCVLRCFDEVFLKCVVWFLLFLLFPWEHIL